MHDLCKFDKIVKIRYHAHMCNIVLNHKGGVGASSFKKLMQGSELSISINRETVDMRK